MKKSTVRPGNARPSSSLASVIRSHGRPLQPLPMGSGCSGRPCERITLANELLGLAFPGRTVDFFTGVTEQHFQPPDRLHLNAAGQALHAERAAAVIASPLR